MTRKLAAGGQPPYWNIPKLKNWKIWVRHIVQQRENSELFDTLVQEMQFGDKDCYFKHI